jgi:hypothetical protein
MSKVTTYDTYESTWYVLNGGVIKEVEFKKVQPNHQKKEGHVINYKITIDNIDEKYIQQWKMYQADGNIREFANARKKLKRKIRKVKRKKKDYE